MTRKKPAELSPFLVKKGEATPTTAKDDKPQPEPPQKPAERRKPVQGYSIKAMSLKVDHDRYIALKQAGLMLGRTSQDILIEALDLWLERFYNESG